MSIKVQKYFDREWPQDRHLVLNQKYDLCAARLEEVEPKWYENKWLYLLIGAFSVKSIDEAFKQEK